MKNISAFILPASLFFILYTQTVNAQSSAAASLDRSSDLSRLNYYPHAGKFLLMSTLGYSSTTATISGQAPVVPNTIESNAVPWVLDLKYGLLPGLRLNISETERILGSRMNQNNQNTTLSSGLSNPTLGVIYRFLEEQNANGWSGDFRVQLDPNWVAPGTGRIGAGYGTMVIAVPIYWGSETNEIGFAPALTRVFTHLNPDTSALIDDAYWSTSITLNERYHLDERWFVESTFALNFGAKVGEPAAQLQQSPFSISPTLTVGYKRENGSLVTALLNYSNSTDVLTPDAGGAQTNTNTADTTVRVGIAIEI